MAEVAVCDGSTYRRQGWQPIPGDIPDPTNPTRQAIIDGAGYRPDLATLTPSGTITVDQDDAVVQGLDVAGTINIKANNVTIRDCRVVGYNGVFVVRYHPGFHGGLVEYVEIHGQDHPTDPLRGSGSAIGGTGDPSGCTWRNLYIHGNCDGAKPGTGGLLYRSYMNVYKLPGSSEHRDGLQISGRSHIAVLECVADLDLNTGGNTGFFVQAWNSPNNVPVSDVTFEGLYATGGNRGIEVRGGKDVAPLPPGYDDITELVTGCRVVNNRLFGPFRHNVWVIDNSPSHEISGNTYEGQPWPEAP